MQQPIGQRPTKNIPASHFGAFRPEFRTPLSALQGLEFTATVVSSQPPSPAACKALGSPQDTRDPGVHGPDAEASGPVPRAFRTARFESFPTKLPDEI